MLEGHGHISERAAGERGRRAYAFDGGALRNVHSRVPRGPCADGNQCRAPQAGRRAVSQADGEGSCCVAL